MNASSNRSSSTTSASEMSGTADLHNFDGGHPRESEPHDPGQMRAGEAEASPSSADEDEFDWNSFGEVMRKRDQARRADNRQICASQLIEAGVRFESKNFGAHLIVRALGQTFDFWPGTGLWQQRGAAQRNRGVDSLIARCKPAGDAS